MGSMKVYATVAGFLALASSVSAARAADLLSPPPPPPPPMEAPADFGGGWYLRGDVGVGSYEGGRMSNASAPELTYYNRDFGSSAFVGAGVGYQFNSWFRADVTGEYRFSGGWKWDDRSSWHTRGATTNYNTTGYERTSVGHRAAVFLLNGYFDLGTWYGITPFVGAGIGFAHHNLKGGNTDTLNVSGPYFDNVTGAQVGGLQTGVSGGFLQAKDQTKLAWALHAGLGYDVTQNLKFEVAYRYLNMGSVTTGGINCYCNATYAGFKVKDVESHDVKLGLRWALGGPTAAPAPAFEPAPLMRKY